MVWIPLLAQFVVMGAGLVTAWGLIGQWSHHGPPGVELDYVIHPPIIARLVETVATVLSVIVTVLVFYVLYRAARGGRTDRRWSYVFAASVLLGLVLGVGARIATAGTIGANIGFGLMMLLALPAAVLAWLAWTAVWAWRIGRSSLPRQ